MPDRLIVEVDEDVTASPARAPAASEPPRSLDSRQRKRRGICYRRPNLSLSGALGSKTMRGHASYFELSVKNSKIAD
jgi:hypothetical protein